MPDQIIVKSGETFSLDGSASYDSDGGGLSYLWFQYPETGTFKKTIAFNPAENISVIQELKAPEGR